MMRQTLDFAQHKRAKGVELIPSPRTCGWLACLSLVRPGQGETSKRELVLAAEESTLAWTSQTCVNGMGMRNVGTDQGSSRMACGTVPTCKDDTWAY
eukprot:3488682-Rhodomonas_salina.4